MAGMSEGAIHKHECSGTKLQSDLQLLWPERELLVAKAIKHNPVISMVAGHWDDSQGRWGLQHCCVCGNGRDNRHHISCPRVNWRQKLNHSRQWAQWFSLSRIWLKWQGERSRWMCAHTGMCASIYKPRGMSAPLIHPRDSIAPQDWVRWRQR